MNSEHGGGHDRSACRWTEIKKKEEVISQVSRYWTTCSAFSQLARHCIYILTGNDRLDMLKIFQQMPGARCHECISDSRELVRYLKRRQYL
ncbi:hypothetical protein [Klebsiella oxytoca]|uniref:hypothetical protein n=1 Tax=Klebsiella oxytoca TaxID=571 RepID=UPI00292DE7EE|nr:hypothetical protein [Klebsiella oxytoca]